MITLPLENHFKCNVEMQPFSFSQPFYKIKDCRMCGWCLQWMIPRCTKGRRITIPTSRLEALGTGGECSFCHSLPAQPPPSRLPLSHKGLLLSCVHACKDNSTSLKKGAISLWQEAKGPPLCPRPFDSVVRVFHQIYPQCLVNSAFRNIILQFTIRKNDVNT